MRNRLFSAGRAVYLMYLVSAILMTGITAMLDMLPGKYICVMAAFIVVFAVILEFCFLTEKEITGHALRA